jgi:FKBP-type peptidyl-prolyl cis-trans isomerase FkpA
MNLKQFKRISRQLFLPVLMVFVITGCKQQPGFVETETGLKYRFHVQNPDSMKIEMYDLVEVLMNYRTADTILFQAEGRPISFQIDPITEGDLLEGIMMMRKGDSATFGISPEKFFIEMMNYAELPENVEGADFLYFDIKVLKISPEPERLRANRLEKRERRLAEPGKIQRYVTQNNIQVSPTQSGLYIIELQAGEGREAKAGDMVTAHFSGSFLNGQIFDSSYERGVPITFELGKGEVIPAWDEAIAGMKAGGKVRLISPSSLAYGDQQRGNIKPYTPLIFEIELIEVRD